MCSSDLLGSAAFSGTAGELRYSYSSGTDITTVTADADGDGDPDLLINLFGQILLTADQFIL